ncbi:MAG TPA: hypothetical protein VEJ84_24460 [Acidimicrobiales bacterium]|nr:hypothetical protein [Acidimicrobiales bacterium]
MAEISPLEQGKIVQGVCRLGAQFVARFGLGGWRAGRKASPSKWLSVRRPSSMRQAEAYEIWACLAALVSLKPRLRYWK